MPEWTKDELYSDETSEIAKLPVKGRISLIFISAIILFVSAIWAYFSNLSVVTHGAGVVIPTSGIREVENLEGGIVTDIFVHAGDKVDKGDSLVRLTNPPILSSLQQARVRRSVYQLKLKRLTAELNDTPLVFTDEEKQKFPVAVAREQQIYEVRKKRLSSLNLSYKYQLEQTLAQETGINQNILGLEEQLKLLNEEGKIIFPRVEQGILPVIQSVNLQKEISEISNQLNIQRAKLPEIHSAISTAEQKIIEVEQSWYKDTAEKLAATQNEIEQINERILSAQDAVDRGDMVAKVNSIVKTLNVNSIGDVVKPGETVIELVPLDEKLLIEARLDPKDRGQLIVGAATRVSIAAYDPSIYGSLKGKVVGISPDSVQDKHNPNKKYFTVLVSTESDFLVDKVTGAELKITPGMPATVDIETGQLSVWTRALRPIRKMLRQAAKEG